MEYMKLGDIVNIRTGKLNANVADEKGSYPFFTCSKKISSISSYSYDTEAVLVAGNGDLNVKYYKGKFDAYQRTYIITDNSSNQLYMPFLYFYMSAYVAQLRNQAIGGVIKYIKLQNLTEAEIRLPSIEQQKEIVKFLQIIQGVINDKKNEMSKLDELIKARFVEMFGDPVLNSNNYKNNYLEQYIEFITSGSRGWSKYYKKDGKYWFITIKNVKNSHITKDNMQTITPPDNQEAKRTKVKEGDLLISITADLGRTGVVTKDIADHGSYINQHLTCLRLNTDRINPVYVSYFLESSAGKRQFSVKNQNGVKAGLNFKAIKKLKILIPPLSLQNKFVNFVQQVDKSKVAVQKSLEETQTLFASLMQKYFS